VERPAAQDGDGTVPAARIHVPESTLGEEPEPKVAAAEAIPADGEAQSEDGAVPKPRKKTRRGSRGGRNRRKKPAAASANGDEEPAEASANAEEKSGGTVEKVEPVSDEYVTMS